MSSVIANTFVPQTPTSTIVCGSRHKRTYDESVKREKCLWFERKLRLKKYLRDKKNDERNVCGETFIRLNSKILLCSYEMPAADLSKFIKRLHHILTPGLKVNHLKITTKDYRCSEIEEKNLKVYFDWITCSDLTVQVFPKFPNVLWFDLECMTCKTSGKIQKNKDRHFNSKPIIATVVTVVLQNVGVHASVENKCDQIFVTRGNTCGMHMFFPQVIVQSEYDCLEIWAAVNKRLLDVKQKTATVDTGCSAMPLPLARNHNGLTRIVFERKDDCEEITIHSYQVDVPTVNQLARFTNFSHLLETASPPSSSIVSESCASAITKMSSTCVQQDQEVIATPQLVVEYDEAAFGTIVKNTTEQKASGCLYEIEDGSTTGVGEMVRPELLQKKGDVLHEPVHEAIGVLCDTEAEKENSCNDELKSYIGHTAESKVHPTGNNPVTITADETLERDSIVSSTSSKRLKQVDLHTIYAKAEKQKRKNSVSREDHLKKRKTSSHESVITINNDEMEECTEERSLVLGSSTPYPDGSVCDAASSFIFCGPVPSVKSSEFLPTSVASTNSTLSSMKANEKDEDLSTSKTPCGSVPNGTVANNSFKYTIISSDDRPPPQTDSNVSPKSLDRLQALYVQDDSVPLNARLPEIYFRQGPPSTNTRNGKDYLQRIAQAKEEFKTNMRSNLNSNDSQTHETDTQFIVSGFNTEMNFYIDVVNDSSPLVGSGIRYDGLRIKQGCSLHGSRENCPSAMFPEHVPFVLYSEDFVTETEWISVLIRYFDEYINNAPFLHVMSHVLKRDENVKKHLNEQSRQIILQSVENCLARFRMNTMISQSKNDHRHRAKISNRPKHPYDEKCTVVNGIIAVCSLAFKIVTPIFSDMAKICHHLLSNTQPALDFLNSSTMSTTTSGSSESSVYCTTPEDDCFDESVSRASGEETYTAKPQPVDRVTAKIDNNHVVIASILRWTYPSLDDQTLWSLFFYYYHVHADGLTRILDEVVHGGLMVTAILQAYIEDFANSTQVDMRMVCSQTYAIHSRLSNFSNKKEADEESLLMPPPFISRGTKKINRKKGNNTNTNVTTGGSPTQEKKAQEFNKRNQNSKKAQQKMQDAKHGLRYDDCQENEEIGKNGDSSKNDDYYLTSFDEVLSMIVNRYLRPVSFDEITVVYTESGYDQCQNEFTSFFSTDKENKRTVTDVFTRSTLKYSMPHGDLLLYNTDIMGTVHRRSSCTNNLVLNMFENMYGGCMSYLTRRFNNHLKIFNRFNGDAYKLIVECRHAMNELVRSIELSYLNLILRQPILPPVLETDISIRHMFMSEEEMLKGGFVCLNTMDYVRSINMYTRHSKLSQENCKITESFLDQVITDQIPKYDSTNEETRMLFRTVYIFYLLYIFEVLYKIRHAYNRDGSYRVSVERLCWEMDVCVLLKLFFGPREFKVPRGLSPEVLNQLDLPTEVYGECSGDDNTLPFDDGDDINMLATDGKVNGSRCINTRPLVSTEIPDKMARMIELFGNRGIVVMKSYAPLGGSSSDPPQKTNLKNKRAANRLETEDYIDSACSSPGESAHGEASVSYEEQDRVFLEMTQSQLEEALYSSTKWYENCRIRIRAVSLESKDTTKSEKHLGNLEMCMDSASMDTFLRTQLRINIDNDRLGQIERSVRSMKDFYFCTHLPLRVKMIALVLATHSIKRLTADVAGDFVRKEYRLERAGVVRFSNKIHVSGDLNQREKDDDDETAMEVEVEDRDKQRPDIEWKINWAKLLSKRKCLLTYCRTLANINFPESYFVGLEPENAYQALYNYMMSKPKYITLHTLQNQTWAKDVCAALNYLLVMNAYDPELVELCLRLFLGFEWPGQWAKRIFVWKSNSNAGKSFFFEHIIRKAFDQSTCINDPKGGKENAPEKSEYYKNFVLMINEFTSASANELKKLCSTSSYKFRMNFGNNMIQAFAVGKMVFNCNKLPLTTDHATIQRVALVPLPFWFQKRQTVIEAMLNWTRGQSPLNEYEKNFRRNVSQILTMDERKFFIENRQTKNESELFNKPNEKSLQLLNELKDQNARSSMFLVQNKTSQVYMLSNPTVGTIISGIISITRYFCRFRFFNTIKEPVDYSVLPTASNTAAQEWQRISQPYFEWKELYQVHKDSNVRTKVSVIHASLNHFAKNRVKNVSFFDLRQFFEWDFADHKIPYYDAKEDEYYISLDPVND